MQHSNTRKHLSVSKICIALKDLNYFKKFYIFSNLIQVLIKKITKSRDFRSLRYMNREIIISKGTPQCFMKVHFLVKILLADANWIELIPYLNFTINYYGSEFNLLQSCKLNGSFYCKILVYFNLSHPYFRC